MSALPPDCVAKPHKVQRTGNNKIGMNNFLNQYCTLALDLESMLRVGALKIVLQHNPPESGY
jgi:hypothetical protein